MGEPASIPSDALENLDQYPKLQPEGSKSSIAALCIKYPNLRYPDLHSPLRSTSGKVVCLDLTDSKKPIRRDLDDPAVLQSHLESTEIINANNNESRRLFLVEGYEPQLVTMLCQHFDVDPLVTLRQQRTASWELYHHSGNTPALPSLLDPNRGFHIPYYELHYYPQGLPDELDCRCADSGRQISSSRMPGTFDRVGIVDRKASFWSCKHGINGWDGKS